jgi:hypothetical protein
MTASCASRAYEGARPRRAAASARNHGARDTVGARACSRRVIHADHGMSMVRGGDSLLAHVAPPAPRPPTRCARRAACRLQPAVRVAEGREKALPPAAACWQPAARRGAAGAFHARTHHATCWIVAPCAILDARCGGFCACASPAPQASRAAVVCRCLDALPLPVAGCRAPCTTAENDSSTARREIAGPAPHTDPGGAVCVDSRVPRIRVERQRRRRQRHARQGRRRYRRDRPCRVPPAKSVRYAQQ